MASPNVTVDRVQSIARPAQPAGRAAGLNLAAVQFQGGQVCQLDLADPRARAWAAVLESLRLANLPAFVETDPASNRITRVLCPRAVTVAAVAPAPAGDRREVELEISHARHFLRRSNPDFEELRRTLEEAREKGSPILVTETLEQHEIIDARPVPGEPAPGRRAPRRR